MVAGHSDGGGLPAGLVRDQGGPKTFAQCFDLSHA
jgi:hypothetical protein